MVSSGTESVFFSVLQENTNRDMVIRSKSFFMVVHFGKDSGFAEVIRLEGYLIPSGFGL
jgi:hypothetical protein